MNLPCDKFFARTARACDKHVGSKRGDPPNFGPQAKDVRRLTDNPDGALTLHAREFAHEIPAFRPTLAIRTPPREESRNRFLSCPPGNQPSVWAGQPSFDKNPRIRADAKHCSA